jgi:hypothetical protein
MRAISRRTALVLAVDLVVLLGPSLAWAQAYPVKKSSNGRYLVDQNNSPFLIAGDAPQSLTVNLSTTEADMYLADRASHAFNSVWINLICTTYTAGRADGSTFDGILPFTGYLAGGADGTVNNFDLSKPNETFFARCDQMITLAANHGLLVFLDPVETGGWLTCLGNNGATACRAYGRYLGNRYKAFKNIVWMSGNDFQGWRTAANDSVVTAVALGIKDLDSSHIHTVELDFNVSNSLDDPSWAPIIALNASYTYYPTYAEVLNGYNLANFEPVFMVEANYEFENNTGGPVTTNALILRKQEYWTNLSGATGQIYGNHYTWTFANGWQNNLDTPGAKQMVFLQALFTPRTWYNLVPDQNHSVLTAGTGTFSSSGQVSANDYAAAARTPDGNLVLAYLPTLRTVTVDMTKLSGATTARWYDPSNGSYTAIAGSPFPNTGARNFTPPGNNSGGDPDWVLVLEATTGGATAPTITSPPASLTVTAGQTATFRVTAGGTTPLSYQWQKSVDGGSTWSAVGTSASSYTTAATTPTDNGAQFRVIVSNTAGVVTSAAATLTVTSGGGGGSVTSYRVNAGGAAVAPFSADADFTGGTAASTTAAVSTAGVTLPAPQGVYQTERYGQTMGYSFPGLTPGASYTVRLHFAEIFWTMTGQRVFNVTLDGQAVLSNFDIVAAAGGPLKAIVSEFTIPVPSNGQIDIGFTTVVDNAKVSGIEILPAAAGGGGGSGGGGGTGGGTVPPAGGSGSSSHSNTLKSRCGCATAVPDAPWRTLWVGVVAMIFVRVRRR